jgi:tetratricopeptide (TPR) repeat protein
MPLRALGQFSQSQVDLRTTISELVPLAKSPNSLGLTITIFKLSLVWGLIWIVFTWGRISLLRIVVFFLAALAAWTNQRSIGFFGVAFMLLHTGLVDIPWRPAPLRTLPVPPRSLVAGAGLVVTLLLAGWLGVQVVNDNFYLREGVGRRFGGGLTPARYPLEVANTLAGLGDTRYFANLDAAAFLLAHTPGRIFIDGRTEAYSAELWADYGVIKGGGDAALGLLAGQRTEAVGLATAGGSFDRLATSLLTSSDWQLISAEVAGLLFVSGESSRSGTAPGAGVPMMILNAAAERALANAEKLSPTRRADLHLAAGQLYSLAGSKTQQEFSYRLGLDFKPTHPILNHNLGNLMLARQEYAEALGHFEAALRTNPRMAGSALNAGVCQMRLGRPAEAAAAFKKATAIDPDSFQAWANLATACSRSGDRSGAIRALDKALEIKPGDPRLIQQRQREHGRGAGD